MTHSFPTRRSSDLLGQVGSKPRFSNGNVWLLPRRWRMAGAFKAEFSTTSRDLIYPARSNRIGELTLFESLERRVRSIHVPTGEEAIRSEEHTSKLQSLMRHS